MKGKGRKRDGGKKNTEELPWGEVSEESQDSELTKPLQTTNLLPKSSPCVAANAQEM